MYTLLGETKEELEVDRSRFIAISVHIDSSKDIDEALKKAKKEYPKAKHYCYAYCLNGSYKASDDGEPKGTAGRPMLELLKARQLENVLVIVVRYFGGILLGAGRLLRTYVESISKVIDAQNRYLITYKNLYTCELDIAFLDEFKSFLSRYKINIEKIEFNELKVTLEFFEFDDIEKEVSDTFHGVIKLVKSKDKIVIYEEEKNESRL